MDKQSNNIEVLKAALNGFKGTTFAGITTLTNVKMMGGKKNLFQGRVQKLVKSGITLFDSAKGYENRVNKQLVQEGKEPNFCVGDLAWGERVGDSPIITHNDKFYLQSVFLNKPSEVIYILDGEMVVDKEVLNFIKSTEISSNGGNQGGLAEKVNVRTFSFDSVLILKMNGIEYRFEQLEKVSKETRKLAIS